MTYLERTVQRIQLMPLLLALAIAVAFAAGIVIGGPVLHLGVTAPQARVTISPATRSGGEAWELQRHQQAGFGLVDAATLQAAGAWEEQRRAQTPRSR